MRKILIIFVLFIIGCNQQVTGDKSPQIGDVLRAFVGSGANCIHSHQQTGLERLEQQQQQMKLDRYLRQQEHLYNQRNWEYQQDWGRRTFPDYPWP